MQYKGDNHEFLEIKEIGEGDIIEFDNKLSFPLVFVWINSDNSEIKHEGEVFKLPKNSIIALTVFQYLEFIKLDSARLIKFNREFYCVLNHDQEVGCKGLLFFNGNKMPFFQIPESETEKFETFWNVFVAEMQSKDEMQLQMLQMLLKRFIILSTRIYKEQQGILELGSEEADLIREFNFLVESHFLTHHKLKDYAELLNKSSKTLSNIFSKFSEKTPLQIIHERRILEARRLILYTDKSIKEIAYYLGFEDLQTFSRFFKKQVKISPKIFKSGSFANSLGNFT